MNDLINEAIREMSNMLKSIKANDFPEAGLRIGLSIEKLIEHLMVKNGIKCYFGIPRIQEKVNELVKNKIINKETAAKLRRAYSWRGNAIHRKQVTEKQAWSNYNEIKDLLWHYRAIQNNLN